MKAVVEFVLFVRYMVRKYIEALLMKAVVEFVLFVRYMVRKYRNVILTFLLGLPVFILYYSFLTQNLDKGMPGVFAATLLAGIGAAITVVTAFFAYVVVVRPVVAFFEKEWREFKQRGSTP